MTSVFGPPRALCVFHFLLTPLSCVVLYSRTPATKTTIGNNYFGELNSKTMRFYPILDTAPQAVTEHPSFWLTKQLRVGVLCGVLPGMPRAPAMHICKKTDKGSCFYEEQFHDIVFKTLFQFPRNSNRSLLINTTRFEIWVVHTKGLFCL